MNNMDFSMDDFSAAKLKKEFGAKKRELMRNLPQIIAAGLLIIAVLASFAEFKFTNIATQGFAANSILFAMITYITYYIKKHIGKTRGSQDTAYTDARKAHRDKCAEVLKRLDGEHTLSSFCVDWSQNEMECARRNILAGTDVGETEWQKYAALGELSGYVIKRTKTLKRKLKREKISQAEYDLLLSLKALPGEKKLAICRACLVERQRLTPSDLIYETASKSDRAKTPIRLKRVEVRRDLLKLASVTVTLTGVLAVIPEVSVLTITPMAIIMALLKIVSLLWTGFNAEISGETLYTVDAVENFAIQNSILDEVIIWREKHERAEDGRAASHAAN